MGTYSARLIPRNPRFATQCCYWLCAFQTSRIFLCSVFSGDKLRQSNELKSINSNQSGHGATLRKTSGGRFRRRTSRPPFARPRSLTSSSTSFNRNCRLYIFVLASYFSFLCDCLSGFCARNDGSYPYLMYGKQLKTKGCYRNALNGVSVGLGFAQGRKRTGAT